MLSPFEHNEQEPYALKSSDYYENIILTTLDYRCTGKLPGKCLLTTKRNIQFLILDSSGLTAKKRKFFNEHYKKYPNVHLVDINVSIQGKIWDFASEFNVSRMLLEIRARISCIGYGERAHLCASLCKAAYYISKQCKRIVGLEPSWTFDNEKLEYQTNGGFRLTKDGKEYRYYVSKLDAKYVVVLTYRYGKFAHVQYPVGHETIAHDFMHKEHIDFLQYVLHKPLLTFNARKLHVSNWHLGTVSKVFSHADSWYSNASILEEGSKSGLLEVIVTIHGDLHREVRKKFYFGEHTININFRNKIPNKEVIYVYGWPKSAVIKYVVYHATIEGLFYYEYVCEKYNCKVYKCYRYECKVHAKHPLQNYRRVFENKGPRIPGKFCLPALYNGVLFNITHHAQDPIYDKSNFSELLGDVQNNYNIQTISIDGKMLANNWRKCNVTHTDNLIISHPSFRNHAFKIRFIKSGMYCIAAMGQIIGVTECFQAIAVTGKHP